MKLIDKLHYLQQELTLCDLQTSHQDRVMYLLINPEDLKELADQFLKNTRIVLANELSNNDLGEDVNFHSLTDPMFGTTYIIPSDRIEKGKLKVLKDNFISVPEEQEVQ